MKKKHLQLILCLICLVVGLTCIGCGSGERKVEQVATNSVAGHKFITPTPITNGPKDEVQTSLPSCSNDLLRSTVAGYYQALKRQDVEAIKEFVSVPVNVTADKFTQYYDVADIKIKRIYAIEAGAPVNYICYVYYEVSFNDILTAVPALDELLITMSGEDYKIINGAIPVSVYSSVQDKIGSNSEITSLKNSVNKLFDDVVKSDPSLLAKIDLDKKGAVKPEGETNEKTEGNEPSEE